MAGSNSFPFRDDRIKALIDAGEYKDSSLSGFSIRVSKVGKKTFQVRRKRNGKDIRVKIGEYPAMNLKQAKDEAYKKLSDIENGINPNEQKKELLNKEVTLQEAFNSYISERDLKPKTVVGYKQVISCYLFDWVSKPLISLTEDEIIHLHKDVSKRSKAQADLMVRVLRAIFNFAKYEYRGKNNTFIFSDNPAKIISHKRQWNKPARKNTRIRSGELGVYLSALQAVRNNTEYNYFTRSVTDACEFALFTGLRKGEVLGLEWSRVNIKAGYYWIDETKNGDPLELPITKTLRQILLRCWENRDESAQYVFRGNTNGNLIVEPKKVIDKIAHAINVLGSPALNINWHDLRRTFGTLAESIGVSSYTLKRLVNHKASKSADVTAGYIVLDYEELIEPATKVEQAILKHAGLIKAEQGVDTKLIELLGKASEADKRALIFQLSNTMERKL
jgi:integrase